MTDQRAIQLQQLANIVIDAYLNRDTRFKPEFGSYKARLFLRRPSADKDHPDLQLGYWYDRRDFEPEDRS
jgi:hypothetical protein